MNAIQEELANWAVFIDKASELLSDEDKANIHKIVSGLIKCRLKDVEGVIEESYPEAN